MQASYDCKASEIIKAYLQYFFSISLIIFNLSPDLCQATAFCRLNKLVNFYRQIDCQPIKDLSSVRKAWQFSGMKFLYLQVINISYIHVSDSSLLIQGLFQICHLLTSKMTYFTPKFDKNDLLLSFTFFNESCCGQPRDACYYCARI